MRVPKRDLLTVDASREVLLTDVKLLELSQPPNTNQKQPENRLSLPLGIPHMGRKVTFHGTGIQPNTPQYSTKAWPIPS